ncbi:MAG: 50S ribosomal protein L28 [Candidatus Portnoybacteria bacterium CG10_big_fil_rev_8_21_14_0_10_44_7]|uniref:50S ribosomal protein L28 n=1 Tax=Candidatus Portnoybacteria bacterium CG10_big_fil_rev_8_21_14_0_10_44_7 TaxID=1974816 RepID=A0A2M8KIT6_9BACT|nr:MAG: 50S ribosomal protein L28 [Candidatus Portnoybacteria bacterium CG10_big_fil_rev_8_21_14_0_10_44_7]
MSRRCAVCGKGSLRAVSRVKLRGKYNPTAIRRQYPNLQQATHPQTGRKIKVCAKCLKNLPRLKQAK